ncbi:OprD family outer membrane porin [Sulfurovum sp. ST-21]|uniref:Outer membrane porin, OprD family n=1 Tax=Sulfurovum indicum TaxID=2779528 RepID=A0A7M1S2N5_9BACT|nr:OprD family outer membrane porin [Sulfurovum indicum]QOR61322.1 outer membrane porin, OprD family [Sulfurovum indicum]
MKLTKLSLVAALAISTAVAGGDIAPVEPVVEAPAAEACNANTTINGKAQLYYYTDDSIDLFDKDSSELGAAVTLDITHKINENISANFTAVGYTNLIDENYPMEGQTTGAYLNVANITASYENTTFILGRQLLDTPMLGGFDWLLAPGSFEAYTVANSSIENITLVGSYVKAWRPNNSGNDFIDLTNIGDGNNWTVGAAYDNKTLNGSIWYYNVDAAAYTQVYVDAGYNFASVQLAAQYVNTDYDTAIDSDLFGVKIAGELAGFSLMAAYANVSDNIAGYVGRDTIYTSSWNTFTSNSVGDAFKVEAANEFNGLSATASYAYYEYEQSTDNGHEFDLILGYGLTNCISADLVYSNTNYGSADDINALEIIATYKF